MREYLVALAESVREAVISGSFWGPRGSGSRSTGGDPQFVVDEHAEYAVERFVKEAGLPVVVLTEEHGERNYFGSPEWLLIVDPIDGSRPAAAGLEMACVSVAAATPTACPRIGDVQHSVLLELRTGAWIYAGREVPGLVTAGYSRELPALSGTTSVRDMFWSFEFNGHPARFMTDAYGHLIDASAATGGVFVFNSATYSISRIVTGQLDAYVDIGNRLLRDRPELEPAFRSVGRGHILHLFPYDIAAAVVLAVRAGVTISDAYGEPLDGTLLTDLSPGNQRSCVAACTKELHQKLLRSIRW